MIMHKYQVCGDSTSIIIQLLKYYHYIMLNTFGARLIQAVRAKTACSHMALHEHNSGIVSGRAVQTLRRLSKSCSL